MHGYTLFAVCNIAYMTCFVVLGVLALVMHVLTTAFPERSKGGDAAVIAAVSSTIAAFYPQAQVTKIEEES
jgi:hypothetical protein